jgi:hypothetical protein
VSPFFEDDLHTLKAIFRTFSCLPGRCARLIPALATLALICGRPALALAVDGDSGSPQTSPTSTAAAPAPAGQSTSSSSQPTGQPTGQPPGTSQQPPHDAEEKQRLAVNPITGLVVASPTDYTPLTGEERWKVYFKMNYFSAGAYFGPFFAALALDQDTGSPAQWGGGFRGYARRVASRTGSAILQGTFQAPAAVLLHEDVRFIVSGQAGFKRRAVHAILYSFLTYNNQGHPTLNIANLGGYYASTAVSTAWLPGRYNKLNYTLLNGTEQIGLSVPVNEIQEFWPEIRRYVFRRH